MVKKITTAVATVALFAMMLFLAFLYLTPPADAATPYGGCKESVQVLDYGDHVSIKMLSSEGVRDCRRMGWFINRHVVSSPDGQAWTNLPACENEDHTPRPCYWNARQHGNGLGYGFVALPGRTLYVDKINGVKASWKREHYWYLLPWVE